MHDPQDPRDEKDPLLSRLRLHGISRRDFFAYCGGLAAALALPGCSADKTAKTLSDAGTHTGKGKPAVLWLNAQDCNGCSISFLNLDQDDQRQMPSVASVILDTISLRYHEPVMASSGHLAEQAKSDTIAEGGYILVVEGAIPESNDRFCVVGGAPIRETLLAAADKASFIIALGSCAVSGGVVRDMVTRGRPVSHFVTGKTVINLPMCPANHEHLLLTIVGLLTEKTPPALDEHNRPLQFFEKTVHLLCSRLPRFSEGKFLSDWNDPVQKDYCLLNKGCKGPSTHADCPERGFNGGISNCTAIGSPCQGCAAETYYDGKSLYASS